MPPRARVGLVTGGASYHERTFADPRFSARFARNVYLPSLATRDLDGLDVVVVSDRQHPRMLARQASLLVDVADRGDTLVVLGENRAHTWLPGLGWEPRPTNFWWWRERLDSGIRARNPEHCLWRTARVDDLTWHFHGVLHPPPGVTPLLVAEQEGEEGVLLYDVDAGETGSHNPGSGLSPRQQLHASRHPMLGRALGLARGVRKAVLAERSAPAPSATALIRPDAGGGPQRNVLWRPRSQPGGQVVRGLRRGPGQSPGTWLCHGRPPRRRRPCCRRAEDGRCRARRRREGRDLPLRQAIGGSTPLSFRCRLHALGVTQSMSRVGSSLDKLWTTRRPNGSSPPWSSSAFESTALPPTPRRGGRSPATSDPTSQLL